MARPACRELAPDIPVPPQTRFPVELRPAEDFDPDDLRTGPRGEGRLERVGGRLLYTPAAADRCRPARP